MEKDKTTTTTEDNAPEEAVDTPLTYGSLALAVESNPSPTDDPQKGASRPTQAARSDSRPNDLDSPPQQDRAQPGACLVPRNRLLEAHDA
jgi:hypothetical protein